jgi:hypothetical protein
MGTYDGDVVAWKYMLPYSYISGEEFSLAGGDQYYIYQTNLRLPRQWNMTYDADTGEIVVVLYGSAGLCGQSFDAAKSEQEYGIILDVPNYNNSNSQGDGSGADPGIVLENPNGTNINNQGDGDGADQPLSRLRA